MIYCIDTGSGSDFETGHYFIVELQWEFLPYTHHFHTIHLLYLHLEDTRLKSSTTLRALVTQIIDVSVFSLENCVIYCFCTCTTLSICFCNLYRGSKWDNVICKQTNNKKLLPHSANVFRHIHWSTWEMWPELKLLKNKRRQDTFFQLLHWVPIFLNKEDFLQHSGNIFAR